MMSHPLLALSGKIAKYIARALVVVWALLATKVVTAGDDGSISPRSALPLYDSFSSNDREAIIGALNRPSRIESQKENWSFLRDIWIGNKYEYPELDWRLMNDNAVRMRVASALTQAFFNGILDLPIDTIDEIHMFAVKGLRDGDPGVIIHAAMILSRFDDSRDVDELYDLAASYEMTRFHAAVLSMAQMCNDEAQAALDRLEEVTTDAELASFIRTTRFEYRELREDEAICRMNERIDDARRSSNRE